MQPQPSVAVSAGKMATSQVPQIRGSNSGSAVVVCRRGYRRGNSGMNGKEKNEALRQKLNELLKEAVAQGNYREVARLAKMAEEAVALDEQEKEIADRRENLLTFLQSGTRNVASEDDASEPRPASARERGNRVRARFIAALSNAGIS